MSEPAKVTREHREAALVATNTVIPSAESAFDRRVYADRLKWLDEGGLHEVGEYEFSVDMEAIAEAIAEAEERGRAAERAHRGAA